MNWLLPFHIMPLYSRVTKQFDKEIPNGIMRHDTQINPTIQAPIYELYNYRISKDISVPFSPLFCQQIFSEIQKKRTQTHQPTLRRRRTELVTRITQRFLAESSPNDSSGTRFRHY